MTLEIFLFFDGKCREALEFYAVVFRQTVPETIIPYAQDPSSTASEADRDRILYADLSILDSKLMLSDCPSGSDLVRGNASSLVISFTDVDEMKRVYEMLQEGGTVNME